MKPTAIEVSIAALQARHAEAEAAVAAAEAAIGKDWQGLLAGGASRLRKELSAARDTEDALRLALAAATADLEDAREREAAARRQGKRAELLAILGRRNAAGQALARSLDDLAATMNALYRATLDARRVYGPPQETHTGAGILVDEAYREARFEHLQRLVELALAERLIDWNAGERVPPTEPVPLEVAVGEHSIRLLAEFDARYGTAGEALPACRAASEDRPVG